MRDLASADVAGAHFAPLLRPCRGSSRTSSASSGACAVGDRLCTAHTLRIASRWPGRSGGISSLCTTAHLVALSDAAAAMSSVRRSARLRLRRAAEVRLVLPPSCGTRCAAALNRADAFASPPLSPRSAVRLRRRRSGVAAAALGHAATEPAAFGCAAAPALLRGGAAGVRAQDLPQRLVAAARARPAGLVGPDRTMGAAERGIQT